MTYMAGLFSPLIRKFASKDEAAQAIVSRIAARISEAAENRGSASLMLSGGSTPIPVYERLSKQSLPWSKLTVGLVDDRWVDIDHAGSNEKMMREKLLQNRARGLKLFGLKTLHATPNQGLRDIENRIKKIKRPYDLTLMGMGLDGHTASWFPGSKGLTQALDIQNPGLVCAIDAGNSPGAGNHPMRISLTLQAVMNSREIVLFITGEEKLKVFEGAALQSVFDAPIKALLAAGSRFTVYWAP